ncbi:MAG: hypothetical protein M1430_10350 [Betaproteobacteria bacterium]|nr:hypothetical protein [Betaproteobacteria bacterium]
MLELLDTGRMAVKLGKWRGALTGGYALLPCLFAFVVLKVQDLVWAAAPGASQPGLSTLDWIAIGLVGVGMVLALWCVWQLYRDHVHGDYYIDAENYKTRGW